MKKYFLIACSCVLIFTSGCQFMTPTLEQQLQEYIQFYAPATHKTTYQIGYDWGDYLVFMEDAQDAKVHKDSEPFRGFFVLRPYVKKGQQTKDVLKTYLIKPNGEVWATLKNREIPETNRRKQITKNGSSKTTVTIDSPGEAVILSFKNNPSIWFQYGLLKKSGNRYKFTSLTK